MQTDTNTLYLKDTKTKLRYVEVSLRRSVVAIDYTSDVRNNLLLTISITLLRSISSPTSFVCTDDNSIRKSIKNMCKSFCQHVLHAC